MVDAGRLEPTAISSAEVGDLSRAIVAEVERVIVGKRHVLTNRHIVQDDKKAMFDGFRVFTGPDYKKSNPGRVVAVCEGAAVLVHALDDLGVDDLQRGNQVRVECGRLEGGLIHPAEGI